MRKIVHVIENLDDSYGGPAVSVPNLAKRMQDAGHPVVVISGHLPFHRESNRVLETTGVRWIRLLQLPLPMVRITLGLGAALRREATQGSIIHVHNLWNAVPLTCFLASRRRKVDLIVSPRGSLSKWALKQRKILKKFMGDLFQRRMLRLASRVHVTSVEERTDAENYGARPDRIWVVPNIVDPPALLEPVEKSLSQGAGPKFLFLSRIHPKKGLEILLESWVNLGAARAGASLTLAGPIDDGRYFQKIQRLINRCEGSVRYIGPMFGDSKHALFMSHDFFVLPSFSENFGNVVLEALYFQLPVLVTTGTPWQEVKARHCGWYVDPEVSALDIALREALALSRPQYGRMALNARGLAHQYHWESLKPQYESLYQR